MSRYPTGDQKFIQDLNRRTVFHALMRHSPTSRVDIARITFLSPSTVANAVSDLMLDGLVEESGEGNSNGGRKPILLNVIWNARKVVSVSIQARKVTAAVVNLRLEILDQLSLPIGDGEDILQTTTRAIKNLLHRVPDAAPLGIGVSVPGLINRETGVVLSAASYDLFGLPVGPHLAENFSLPVVIENDANAAALGEQLAGAARGIHTFAYVYIGDAVGAGIVVNGQLILGGSGSAGEFGHITVDWQGDQCPCGGRGCLEQMLRWETFYRSVGEGQEVRSIPALEFAPDFIASVVASGQSGDIIDKMVRILGAGLTSLTNLCDPEQIILEGIYSRSSAFIDMVQRATDERQARIRTGAPQIVTGLLGNQAPLLGVAYKVLQGEQLWSSDLAVFPTLGR